MPTQRHRGRFCQHRRHRRNSVATVVVVVVVDKPQSKGAKARHFRVVTNDAIVVNDGRSNIDTLWLSLTHTPRKRKQKKTQKKKNKNKFEKN